MFSFLRAETDKEVNLNQMSRFHWLHESWIHREMKLKPWLSPFSPIPNWYSFPTPTCFVGCFMLWQLRCVSFSQTAWVGFPGIPLEQELSVRGCTAPHTVSVLDFCCRLLFGLYLAVPWSCVADMREWMWHFVKDWAGSRVGCRLSPPPGCSFSTHLEAQHCLFPCFWGELDTDHYFTSFHLLWFV